MRMNLPALCTMVALFWSWYPLFGGYKNEPKGQPAFCGVPYEGNSEAPKPGNILGTQPNWAVVSKELNMEPSSHLKGS